MREGAGYTCEACGEFFEWPEDAEWSEDDAESEYEKLWGGAASGPRSIVCDDCFKKLLGADLT